MLQYTTTKGYFYGTKIFPDPKSIVSSLPDPKGIELVNYNFENVFAVYLGTKDETQEIALCKK